MEGLTLFTLGVPFCSTFDARPSGNERLFALNKVLEKLPQDGLESVKVGAEFYGAPDSDEDFHRKIPRLSVDKEFDELDTINLKGVTFTRVKFLAAWPSHYTHCIVVIPPATSAATSGKSVAAWACISHSSLILTLFSDAIDHPDNDISSGNISAC